MRPMICRALLVLVIVLLMGCAGRSSAQETQNALRQIPPAEQAELQTGFMAETLNLSDDQQSQVQAINLKYANQMQPILASNDRKLAKFRQFRKLSKQKDAELKEVLTEVLYDQYQVKKEEIRDKIKAKRREKRSP